MIQNREALAESETHEQALDCIEATIDTDTPEAATQFVVSMDGRGESPYGGGCQAHRMLDGVDGTDQDHFTELSRPASRTTSPGVRLITAKAVLDSLAGHRESPQLLPGSSTPPSLHED